MKHLAAFALFTIGSMSFGQTCIQNDLGWDSVNTVFWADGAMRAGGGYVGSAIDDMAGHALVFRIDAEGNMVWGKRVDPTNPDVWLLPKKTVATTDGGMAVFGYRYDHTGSTTDYVNMFVLKYDAAGNQEWARIYMMSSVPSYDWSNTTSLAALPDGNLLLAVARGNGICAVKLDADGVPLWLKRYDPATTQQYWNVTGHEVLADPDGTIAYLGNAQNDLWVVRTEADGTPLWSYRYGTGNTIPTGITRCANGDFIVIGRNSNTITTVILRLDANGTVIWSKTYALGVDWNAMHDVGELTNGDLFFTGRYGVDISALRTNAAGDALEQWSADPNERIIELVGTANDSLRFVLAMNVDQMGQYPLLTIAPSLADLSCAIVPTTASSTTPLVITGITDTLSVAVDSIKTWTLAAGTPMSDNERDLTTYLCAGCARPGFEMAYYANIYNMGGLPSGPITATMTFDPLLGYISATPAPTTVTANTLTWALPAAAAYSMSGLNGIHIQFQVPVDATLGHVLEASLSATQDSTETSLINNTAISSRTITGSYDPNDKLVWPAGFYHIENDSILDYTIRFQNTGTDTAFTVVVRDTLPLDLDATTFRMGATSHPCTYSLTGNGILTFTFADILLPDSSTNEPLSHGLVNFRIQPILPLQLGQEITNRADIYFDFNPPIRTPDATVVVTDETGVRPVVKPEKLTVFPVPVRTLLTAQLPSGFEPVHAFAIGTDGRRIPLFRPNVVEKRAEYGVQHLPPGAYVLTLVDPDGRRMSARFTKE